MASVQCGWLAECWFSGRVLLRAGLYILVRRYESSAGGPGWRLSIPRTVCDRDRGSPDLRRAATGRSRHPFGGVDSQPAINLGAAGIYLARVRKK